MASIFETDSPLMRFLSRFADVMVLNFFFIVTSLPVVTIGASLTALNYTAMKLTAGTCESVREDYLRSWRLNLRQATVIWALVLGMCLVLWAWFVVAEYLNVPGVVRFFLYAVVYLVAFRFVIALIYVFPYLAKFEGTTREVIRNARIMSLRHLFSSLAMLLVVGLPVVITIFYPELTGYGMLWLAFGFAAIAFVNAHLLRAIFARYVPAEPDPRSRTMSGESQGVS
ncbi:YesL family protein [Salana multivorans]